jgi:hypothetical protein
LRNDTDNALVPMIGLADEYSAIDGGSGSSFGSFGDVGTRLHFVNFTDTDDEILDPDREDNDSGNRRVVHTRRDDFVSDTLFEGVRIREVNLGEGMSVGAGLAGYDALHVYIDPRETVRVVARWYPDDTRFQALVRSLV